MILQKSVQEIIETAKVEDVIQDFVTLKRRGVNLIGLCPFHNEKTPSFTVSPTKNIYKCFGCGQAGNPVQFLMEHEHLTFPEALRYLAKKYDIKIEETEYSKEAVEQQQQLDSLFIINDYAKNYFQEQLLHTDLGKSVGLSYFKERGFHETTIKKFGLGFASDKKDGLTTKAVKEGHNIELLRKLGLTNKFDGDFFRNRVMFAIHNLSGKVVGFGGRILLKNVKAPKYINSPETEVYNKSKILYGAFFAKRAIRQEDECIMVEGYTDVLSLHQAGIENVVSSSGTSLTVDQIRLVKRYSPNIKILFDGDLAGIKAAIRGLDLVLEQDLNVKIVLLPEGEDPDSYLNKVGVSNFRTFLKEQAKDFIMFKTDLLLKESANDPIKKTELIKDIVASIARIPDPIKRSLYIRECSQIVKVEEQILVNEMNKVVAKQFRKKQQAPIARSTQAPSNPAGPIEAEVAPATSNQPTASKPIAGDEFQERNIIRVLVNAGGELFDPEKKITIGEFLLSSIEDVLEEFDNKLYQKVAKDGLQQLVNKKPLSAQYFLNHQDPEIAKLAIDLSTSPYEYSENWEKKWEIFLQTQKMPDDNFRKDSEQVILYFKRKKVIRMCEKVNNQIREYQEAGDFEKVKTFILVKMKLDQMKDDLAKKTGTVIF